LRQPPKLFLPPRRRWSTGAIAISIAVHALIFLVKVGAYVPPGGRLPPSQIFLLPPGAEGQRAFDMPYREPGGAAAKGRSAGITPRPQQEQAPTPEAPAVAEPIPAEPLAAEPQPNPPAPQDSGGRGPGVRHIGPAMGDGKLWVRPLPAPPRELAQALTRSHIELVDSAVSAIVQEYIDSVLSAPAPAGARAPSWTTQIFGRTFGIDSKFIYLGGLRIPSAVLALLPIKGGTTMEFSQANRLSLIREDLARASARAQTLDDFKRAIRELRAERERLKEIERNQKLKPEPKDTTRSP
jgi:hypothetical protein